MRTGIPAPRRRIGRLGLRTKSARKTSPAILRGRAAKKQAMPNRKQNTTICRTSPRTSASTMLVGTALSSVSARPAGPSIPASVCRPDRQTLAGLGRRHAEPSEQQRNGCGNLEADGGLPDQPAQGANGPRASDRSDQHADQHGRNSRSNEAQEQVADRPRLRPSAMEMRVHVASENLGMRSTAVRGPSSESAVSRAPCRIPQHVTGIRCLAGPGPHPLQSSRFAT